jgi:hypothetical protein
VQAADDDENHLSEDSQNPARNRKDRVGA